MRRRLLLATLAGSLCAVAGMVLSQALLVPNVDLCIRRGVAGLAGLLTILFQF